MNIGLPHKDKTHTGNIWIHATEKKFLLRRKIVGRRELFLFTGVN